MYTTQNYLNSFQFKKLFHSAITSYVLAAPYSRQHHMFDFTLDALLIQPQSGFIVFGWNGESIGIGWFVFACLKWPLEKLQILILD